MSESISGASEQDYENIHVPRIGRGSLLENNRTWEGKKLHRMMFRREDELIEINHGIEFSLLRDSKD